MSIYIIIFEMIIQWMWFFLLPLPHKHKLVQNQAKHYKAGSCSGKCLPSQIFLYNKPIHWMYLIYCENMDITATDRIQNMPYIHILDWCSCHPHTIDTCIQHSQTGCVRMNLKRVYSLTEPQDIICSKVFCFAIHDLILNTFHMNAFEFSMWNIHFQGFRPSSYHAHYTSV